MSEYFQAISSKETIFVIIGTVLGSFLRFHLIDWFSNLFQRKYLGTIFVNSLSTFFLAIIISSYNKILIFNSGYILFFSVGLLGSLSTFSTFIIDIFQILQKKKVLEAFFIALISILLTLIFGSIGYWVIKLCF